MEENYFTRLKSLLKDSNKTVKSMLEAIEMPLSHYDSLTRYDNAPRADMAVKIAEYLDTTVEYMVTGKDKDSLPSDIMAQVRQLLTLDKQRRAPILANISSQVEFWKGASTDIIPNIEDKTSEEDEELLESYHALDERDRKAVKAMIMALSSNKIPYVD